MVAWWFVSPNLNFQSVIVASQEAQLPLWLMTVPLSAVSDQQSVRSRALCVCLSQGGAQTHLQERERDTHTHKYKHLQHQHASPPLAVQPNRCRSPHVPPPSPRSRFWPGGDVKRPLCSCGPLLLSNISIPPRCACVVFGAQRANCRQLSQLLLDTNHRLCDGSACRAQEVQGTGSARYRKCTSHRASQTRLKD